MGFPGGSVKENLPVNAGDTGDTGSIPGSGGSPEGENGNLLQYSCRENPVDRGAWWAKVHKLQSQTQLKQLSKNKTFYKCFSAGSVTREIQNSCRNIENKQL